METSNVLVFIPASCHCSVFCNIIYLKLWNGPQPGFVTFDMDPYLALGKWFGSEWIRIRTNPYPDGQHWFLKTIFKFSKIWFVILHSQEPEPTHPCSSSGSGPEPWCRYLPTLLPKAYHSAKLRQLLSFTDTKSRHPILSLASCNNSTSSSFLWVRPE